MGDNQSDGSDKEDAINDCIRRCKEELEEALEDDLWVTYAGLLRKTVEDTRQGNPGLQPAGLRAFICNIKCSGEGGGGGDGGGGDDGASPPDPPALDLDPPTKVMKKT